MGSLFILWKPGATNVLMEILEKLGVGILIAFATSFITVRLAFKRFKTEALWNRKLDAYTKLLEALHVARQHYDDLQHEALGVREGTKEYNERMRQKCDASFEEVSKAIDIGSLIISEEATLILKEAMKSAGDWGKMASFEYFELEEAKMRTALDQLIKVAKKDLQN